MIFNIFYCIHTNSLVQTFERFSCNILELYLCGYPWCGAGENRSVYIVISWIEPASNDFVCYLHKVWGQSERKLDRIRFVCNDLGVVLTSYSPPPHILIKLCRMGQTELELATKNGRRDGHWVGCDCDCIRCIYKRVYIQRVLCR